MQSFFVLRTRSSSAVVCAGPRGRHENPALRTPMRRYVTCPAGHRNDRVGGRTRCAVPECRMPLAKRRLPKHAEVLRGDTYPLFVQAAELIHGVSDESCCVCGKPRPQDSRWDRDHGHRRGEPDYGKPRGLACSGNQGCNVLMLPWITASVARAIHLAKLEALAPDAERWGLIADYLGRVEAFYAREEQIA